MQKAPKNAENG